MKKRFLELLIIQAGLTPVDVEPYRTDGCGGMYRIATGWRGRGENKEGIAIVSFETPEGFNDAVKELMKEIYEAKNIEFRTSHDYKL